MADTDAQTLIKAKDARSRILSGAQSVSVNGQSFSLASLAEINKLISELESTVATEEAYAATGSDLLFMGTRFT